MKYGDTLRQRSIPQWAPYNIDYDEIKQLIKEYTSPDSNKPIFIPGQPDVDLSRFENQLFGIFASEHRRINLFVRSKHGEIERRLNHINKQVNRLTQDDHAAPLPGHNLSEKRRQKYGRIEGDALRAGEEIRSLAQFVSAQRLAFAKLLKKYKKWTHSDSLELRFNRDIAIQPRTFSHADLSPMVNYWNDTLQAVREAYHQHGPPHNIPEITLNRELPIDDAQSKMSQSVVSKIRAAEEGADRVQLDSVLSTLPLGPKGARATYWVHPEQAVELLVLLLQTLRPFESKATKSQSPSPFQTPRRRDSFERLDCLRDRADDAGVIFLGDAEMYGRQRSTAAIHDMDETPETPAVRVLGSARWNAGGDAVVSVSGGLHSGDSQSVVRAGVKRKHLDNLLDLDRPFCSRKASGLDSIQENVPQRENSACDSVDRLRSWLQLNRHCRPVAKVCSKRSRFVGTDNDARHGVWATLDRDIHLKAPNFSDLGEGDWPRRARQDATAFPFAVLEVRCEGAQTNNLLHTLDNSHLTERIRGFSLEAHAIWTCCSPSTMQSPHWIPTLELDIRKIPAAVHKQLSRGGTASSNLDPSSSRQTSVSTSSATDVQTSRYTTLRGQSSTTSVDDLEVSPLCTSSGMRRPSDSCDHAVTASQELRDDRPGYWNEYDNPDDSRNEDPYVIYVDPFESARIPGQETLSRIFAKVKHAIGSFRSSSNRDSLLASPRPRSVGDRDGGDTSFRTRSYGTISDTANHTDGTGESSQSGGHSHLIDLFRPPDPSPTARHWSYHPGPVPTLGANPRDLDDLLADLEQRRVEREATKLRLCLTSLAASVVVLMITWTLSTTSRRKLRREVDAMVVVGVVANLVFAMVSVLCAISKRQGFGVVVGLIIAAIVAAVCIADGGLLVWLFS